MRDHKQAAVDFLQRVVAGDIDGAYQKYVDMKGKHHNPFCAAGFEGLKKGMIEVEFWDLAMPITKESLNQDGMF